MRRLFFTGYLLSKAELRKHLLERKAGFFWLVIEPVVLIAIFILVVGEVLKKGSWDGPYGVVLLSGLLGWQAFSRSIFGSCNSVIKYKSLSIDFSKSTWIFSIPLVVYNHAYLLVGSFLLVPIALFYGMSVNPIYIVLGFIFQLIICVICASVVSIIFVSFRDIKAISGLFLRGMWFLSPVLYTTEHFMTLAPSELIKKLFLLNPMVMPINFYRIGFGIVDSVSWDIILGHMISFSLLMAMLLWVNRRMFNMIEIDGDDFY